MTIPLPTPEDLARDLADDYLRVMWMPADGCPGQLALAAIRRAHAAEVALADRDDRAVALVRQRDAAEAERDRLRKVEAAVFNVFRVILPYARQYVALNLSNEDMVAMGAGDQIAASMRDLAESVGLAPGEETGHA